MYLVRKAHTLSSAIPFSKQLDQHHTLSEAYTASFSRFHTLTCSDLFITLGLVANRICVCLDLQETWLSCIWVTWMRLWDATHSHVFYLFSSAASSRLQRICDQEPTVNSSSLKEGPARAKMVALKPSGLDMTWNGTQRKSTIAETAIVHCRNGDLRLQPSTLLMS